MKIAIVIVNYNTLSDTLECLESLKKTTLPKGLILQTIVVDNHSDDDAAKVLQRKYQEIEVISSPSNRGFAGGNNLGIKAALKTEPTHILLLNNDTIIDKNFFKDIISGPIMDKKVGIVTPTIYFAKGFEFHKDRYTNSQLGKVIWSAGGKMDWDNILGSNNHVDEVDNGQFISPTETDFATGACMLIKTVVVEDIGFLNEDYFLYLEDLEFCVRAQKAGWQIFFDPKPKLWHKVSQSSGIGSQLNDYFITRNRLIFGLRYAKLRTKLALLREAMRKLISGTKAQKTAIKDFLLHKYGKGSWLK